MPRRAAVLALALAAGGGLSGVQASASAAGSPVGLRVVGGTSVPSITALPFQVALYVQSPGSLLTPPSLAFCGGVIVDPIQIVTAAHCVIDGQTGVTVNPATVTLSVGTATLPPTVPVQPVAASIAVDPQYNPSTSGDDIAVVTLTNPLYTGDVRADGAATVAPIPLISPALAAQFANPNLAPAQPVLISGWGETAPLAVGATDPSPGLPQQLQAAQTHLVPDAVCTADYAPLVAMGAPPITSHMLCAGEPAGGVDTCAGDSGGPLVVDAASPANRPGDYVLAGLADFGAGCAQAGFPGVYVRLATPEIAGFVAQQAQFHGQQLIAPPAPPAPPPPPATPPPAVAAPAPAPAPAPPAHPPLAGRARLVHSSARVRHRVARVAVRCLTARCTGAITLRTTITVGSARYVIAANATATVAVAITAPGQRQLDRHRHRLRTRATLAPTGSTGAKQALTLTD